MYSNLSWEYLKEIDLQINEDFYKYCVQVQKLFSTTQEDKEHSKMILDDKTPDTASTSMSLDTLSDDQYQPMSQYTYDSQIQLDIDLLEKRCHFTYDPDNLDRAINLEIRQIPVMGHGCFTKQAIEKDTHFLNYHGETVSKANASDDYIYERKIKRKTVFISAKNKGGWGRFLNHSKTPNCQFANGKDTIEIKALRTILPGEELLIDYGKHYFDFCDYIPQPISSYSHLSLDEIDTFTNNLTYLNLIQKSAAGQFDQLTEEELQLASIPDEKGIFPLQYMLNNLSLENIEYFIKSLAYIHFHSIVDIDCSANFGTMIQTIVSKCKTLNILDALQNILSIIVQSRDELEVLIDTCKEEEEDHHILINYIQNNPMTASKLKGNQRNIMSNIFKLLQVGILQKLEPNLRKKIYKSSLLKSDLKNLKLCLENIEKLHPYIKEDTLAEIINEIRTCITPKGYTVIPHKHTS